MVLNCHTLIFHLPTLVWVSPVVNYRCNLCLFRSHGAALSFYPLYLSPAGVSGSYTLPILRGQAAPSSQQTLKNTHFMFVPRIKWSFPVLSPPASHRLPPPAIHFNHYCDFWGQWRAWCILSSAPVNTAQSLCKCIQMHSLPLRPSSLLRGGGGCTVTFSPAKCATWLVKHTAMWTSAYIPEKPLLNPVFILGLRFTKVHFLAFKACAPPMSLCFFIRHAADSNRIARTGSLLHVHGEMGRGGEGERARRGGVCAFSS